MHPMQVIIHRRHFNIVIAFKAFSLLHFITQNVLFTPCHPCTAFNYICLITIYIRKKFEFSTYAMLEVLKQLKFVPRRPGNLFQACSSSIVLFLIFAYHEKLI